MTTDLSQPTCNNARNIKPRPVPTAGCCHLANLVAWRWSHCHAVCRPTESFTTITYLLVERPLATSVAKSGRLMSFFISYFLKFLLVISPKPPSRFLPHLPADGKQPAIVKLSFWFLNSFWRGREVQKGHFRFRPSFKKCNMWQNGFTYRKRKLSDFGRIISLSNAEKRVKIS